MSNFLQDIANHLRDNLPRIVEIQKTGEQLSIVDVAYSDPVVTLTTNIPHQLQAGDYITVSGLANAITIEHVNGSAFPYNGVLATSCKTAINHDITEGFEGTSEVILADSTGAVQKFPVIAPPVYEIVSIIYNPVSTWLMISLDVFHGILDGSYVDIKGLGDIWDGRYEVLAYTNTQIVVETGVKAQTSPTAKGTVIPFFDATTFWVDTTGQTIGVPVTYLQNHRTAWNTLYEIQSIPSELEITVNKPTNATVMLGAPALFTSDPGLLSALGLSEPYVYGSPMIGYVGQFEEIIGELPKVNNMYIYVEAPTRRGQTPINSVSDASTLNNRPIQWINTFNIYLVHPIIPTSQYGGEEADNCAKIAVAINNLILQYPIESRYKGGILYFASPVDEEVYTNTGGIFVYRLGYEFIELISLECDGYAEETAALIKINISGTKNIDIELEQ